MSDFFFLYIQLRFLFPLLNRSLDLHFDAYVSHLVRASPLGLLTSCFRGRSGPPLAHIGSSRGCLGASGTPLGPHLYPLGPNWILMGLIFDPGSQNANLVFGFRFPKSEHAPTSFVSQIPKFRKCAHLMFASQVTKIRKCDPLGNQNHSKGSFGRPGAL